MIEGKPVLLNILYSGLGGHSSVVFSLIEADKEHEFIHKLIFYGVEEMPGFSRAKCKQLGVQFWFVKKKQGIDFDSFRQVKLILKQNLPNAIILHSPNLIIPVLEHTRLYKCKLVTVEHQSNPLKSKKDKIWSVLVMSLSPKIVYLTELYKEQMKKMLGPLYRSQKVTVINNGIDLSIFKREANNDFSPHNEIRLGMLSRLTTIKDHSTLLDMMHSLTKNEKNKSMVLYIAGDGETRSSLEEKCRALHLENNVKFMGLLGEKESVDFLISLDIYVHASYGETMSTSLMQAMACGKVIIASDVEGINNMIKSGFNGMLVPVKDGRIFASTVNALLENPEKQAILKKNAMETAEENFSNQVMFKAYRKLFILV